MPKETTHPASDVPQGVSIDQFEFESRAALDAFFSHWRGRNQQNPEEYPLVIPFDNDGLWNECLCDWLNGGYADTMERESAKALSAESSAKDAPDRRAYKDEP